MARWTPDPSFYPSPRLAAKAPAETLAYVATFDPKRDVPDAIAVVDVDPSSATYSKIVGQVDMTSPRRRAAPFRMERLLVLPLPQRAAPACRAPLSRRAGSALLAHLHHRYQARSAPPDDRQGDRARGADREDRLHAARTPCIAVRKASTSRRSAMPPATGPAASSSWTHETFEVLGRWEVDRGPQQSRLRRLVASRLRHDGDQRMGHAEHVRERPRSRRFCSARNTAGACISGICTSASMCRRSISAPSTSSCSSCARRTTRPRPTASSMA